MSIAPAMAGNQKDGDSYQEPENTQPIPAAPAPEPVVEKPVAPVPPPEAPPEVVQQAPEMPAELTWREKRMNYYRHMDSTMMDAEATAFLANANLIAVFPFVDLTDPTNEGNSVLDQAGGPRRIVEALVASLMQKGYFVLPSADSAAALDQYLESVPVRPGGGPSESSELQNNRFYFDNMPPRAMNYYLGVVPGLQGQYDRTQTQSDYWLAKQDVINLATMLGCDAVIRGYVQEYAVDKNIDADLRTFLPPFLGLISPERRAIIEVAFYLYDGKTGEMVWNGTVNSIDIASWPLFQRDNELMQNNENGVAWGMTGRVTPDWEDLVMNHPDWLPENTWCQLQGMMGGMGECNMEGMNGECNMEGMNGECNMEGMNGECQGMGMGWNRPVRPDWLNPMRYGWHREYGRSPMRFDNEVQREPYKYDNLFHNYNGIRHHPGGSPRD
jgi:hypothetical protein